jgi:hypothetical protein
MRDKLNVKQVEAIPKGRRAHGMAMAAWHLSSRTAPQKAGPSRRVGATPTSTASWPSVHSAILVGPGRLGFNYDQTLEEATDYERDLPMWCCRDAANSDVGKTPTADPRICRGGQRCGSRQKPGSRHGALTIGESGSRRSTPGRRASPCCRPEPGCHAGSPTDAQNTAPSGRGAKVRHLAERDRSHRLADLASAMTVLVVPKSMPIEQPPRMCLTTNQVINTMGIPAPNSLKRN